jgi:hypothetical protein
MIHLVTLYILVTTGSLVYLTHTIDHFLLAASSWSCAISVSRLHLICCGGCYASIHDVGQSSVTVEMPLQQCMFICIMYAKY